MERSKALIASALVAVGLTVGAGVYVAGSGLLAGATDNVGNLAPTVSSTTAPAAPQEITVYVDQATGAATTVAPPAPTAAPVEAPLPAAVPVDDSAVGVSGGYEGEYEYEDESDDDGGDHGSDHDSDERESEGEDDD